MKTLSLLIVLFAASFFKAPVEKSFLPASESLIDMIGRADFIPVYFVTKEVFYNNTVTKNVKNTKPQEKNSLIPYSDSVLTTFSTCKEISEGAPLPESYISTYNKVVSELNRVFKTTKFVLKESSDIPLTEKKGGGLLGVFAGGVASKIMPPLKGFEFSGISAPFFVFCSIGAIYQSKDLLKDKEAGPLMLKGYKDYEKKGVKVLDQITVSLDGFLNVRFLNYDSKKKDVKYTISGNIRC